MPRNSLAACAKPPTFARSKHSGGSFAMSRHMSTCFGHGVRTRLLWLSQCAFTLLAAAPYCG
eukprot:10133114-Alexandrium_andersonii.AAC.1